MTVSEAVTFGSLLRRHRLAVSLSQEALAERAGLSAATIAALERGRRAAPRPETVALLGNALSLSAADRVSFIAAARGREATGSVAEQAPEGTGEEAPVSPPPPLLTLPTRPTVLIGRERDEAAVTRLLLQGGARHHGRAEGAR